MIALLLLGPNQLPGALKKMGKAMGDVKRMSDGFQREVRNAFEDADEEAAARNAGLTQSGSSGDDRSDETASYTPPAAQAVSSLPDGSGTTATDDDTSSAQEGSSAQEASSSQDSSSDGQGAAASPETKDET